MHTGIAGILMQSPREPVILDVRSARAEPNRIAERLAPHAGWAVLRSKFRSRDRRHPCRKHRCYPPKGAFPLEIGEKDADFSRREVKSALRIRV